MTAYGRYIDFDTLREKKNEKNNSSTTGSGSTTTARARTRTREQKQADFCMVMEYAEDALQLRAGRVMQQDVADALEDGIDPEVIIFCVQEAELAPRPSWGYARAVLRRCRNSGVKTAADWEADKNRWGSRNKAGGRFAQREYNSSDSDRFFVQFSDDEV